ncbi:MAG: hypothetical protein DSM106950_22760 [Stigonema ocellatum SAG 48.90 = DSM 106950]|nr:hypothetical protein [Stigonema ocellatum SAG 48.90 = DSM 106950]
MTVISKLIQSSKRGLMLLAWDFKSHADMGAACGLRGGVNSMAWQLGIEELEIIAPSGSKTIIVKPPKTRR